MEEETYIPRDIIRSILSYDSYPRFRLVSREFDMAEQELEEERIQRVKDLYPNPVDAAYVKDWKALGFILKHPHSLRLSNLSIRLIIDRVVKDDKMNIVKIILDRGYNPMDIAISAVTNDKIDILIYVIDRYNIHMLNYLADLAATHNNIHILQYLLDKGASNYYFIATIHDDDGYWSNDTTIRDWVIRHYPIKLVQGAIRMGNHAIIEVVKDAHPDLIPEIDSMVSRR